MKIQKTKDGIIKMTAENKQDSKALLTFLEACAGKDSYFEKIKKERENNNIDKL